MISKDLMETSRQNRQTEATVRNENFPGYDQVLAIFEASPEMRAEIQTLLERASASLEGKPVTKETIAAVVFKLISGSHINR